MSFDALTWAWRQNLKSSNKLTLLALADCLNHETKRLDPSIKYLSDKTGQNRKTVIANLSNLESLGLITSQKIYGTSTHYTLNFNVFNLTKTSTKNGTALMTNTSTKNGTGKEDQTSTKNGTLPVPKTVLDQYQKRDTNQEEPGKNQELLGGKTPKPPQKQKPKKSKFQKPTVDEIIDYKNELNLKGKNYISDPQEFFDYHESSGWVIGKSLKPMKCWKSAFSTWERHQKKWEKKNARYQSADERRIEYSRMLTDPDRAREVFG